MTRPLTRCLQDAAVCRPDTVFWRQILAGNPLAGSPETLTFGELYARACAVAAALRQGGVLPGDVVLVFLPQLPETIVAFCGALLRRAERVTTAGA